MYALLSARARVSAAGERARARPRVGAHHGRIACGIASRSRSYVPPFSTLTASGSTAAASESGIGGIQVVIVSCAPVIAVIPSARCLLIEVCVPRNACSRHAPHDCNDARNDDFDLHADLDDTRRLQTRRAHQPWPDARVAARPGLKPGADPRQQAALTETTVRSGTIHGLDQAR